MRTMIRENIEGTVYTFFNEPTFAAAENVTVFDELLKISFIDLSILKPGDMARNPDDILKEQLKGKRLAEYRAKCLMSDYIRTVMLCTGLTEEELQGAPIQTLYQKSCEVMDGTATDFFLNFAEISRANQIRTRIRYPDYAKFLDELEKIGKENVNDSQKENLPGTDASGVSG